MYIISVFYLISVNYGFGYEPVTFPECNPMKFFVIEELVTVAYGFSKIQSGVLGE